MILVKGDLFTAKADFLLVTTNAFVKTNGELVMGRGAAKQAAQKWPLLPKQLGRLIDGREWYGVILLGGPYCAERQFVGAFQVKRHWRDAADPYLITDSTFRLDQIASSFPQCTFALNFPGIGNGRLEREYVMPIIEGLPDNVYIYEL